MGSWIVFFVVIAIWIFCAIEGKKERKQLAQKKAEEQEQLRIKQQQEQEEWEKRLEEKRKEREELWRQQQIEYERKCRALQISNLDNLSGRSFENYAAWLLRKNGFTQVKVTKQSGDYGADILATDSSGNSCCVQCKRVSSNVGIKAIQEVHTAKQYYHCQVAIVMTNQFFTRQAIETANTCGVRLINREELLEMICRAQELKKE